MPDTPAAREIPPCGCTQPGATSPSLCYCSVEHLLRVIRRRYSLAVMHAIHRHESAQYRDIAAHVPKASSSTLAETLDALCTARLIDKRQPGPEGGQPRYALTPSGEKLLSRLRRLLDDVQQA